MKISVIKRNNALFPASNDDLELFKSMKAEKVYSFDFKQARNYEFHKKFFAMLNIGFDAFEPPEVEYKGMIAQKSFDRFRKDVIISAGYYDVVSNLKGDVRAEAKSISFGNMSEDEFQKLYNNVAQVLLTTVLHNYTKDDLESVVNQLVRF